VNRIVYITLTPKNQTKHKPLFRVWIQNKREEEEEHEDLRFCFLYCFIDPLLSC